MSNILLGYRQDFDKRGDLVKSYSHSTQQALQDLGHTVTAMGEGHDLESFNDIGSNFLGQQALFLDIDSGRNKDGELAFQTEKPPIPSAVRYIDTHGHATLHKRLAENYDHVFFAVWSLRDIFTAHPSAHWCPNASDAKYFYKDILPESHASQPFDIGFFGTKHGLDRADALKPIADRHGWTLDIRQLGKSALRWPHTAMAMAQCKVLFNRGQKHDGPNQRVIESMLMGRPLVTDRDLRDGMSKLFEEGEHYLGYSTEAELAQQIDWCMREPSLSASMARRAYALAVERHQVKHRVEQILEVCDVL
jgi:hypothetical protein